ncbi:hypothetical protein IKG16_01875 [Candidatus Saccharibacteria bacterium]|nr:hypothetical protein [Candidatus Saccharibacteria bacterium]
MSKKKKKSKINEQEVAAKVLEAEQKVVNDDDIFVDEDEECVECVFNRGARDFKMGPREKFGAFLMIALFIFLVGIAVWSYKSKTFADFFSYADDGFAGHDNYYKSLTSGQKVTSLRMFDFKGYLDWCHESIFGKPRFEFHEVDCDFNPEYTEPDPDIEEYIYKRDDSVRMSYKVRFKNWVSVTIETRIEPICKYGSEGIVRDAEVATSVVDVFYYDEDDVGKLVATDKIPVRMTDAVFDVNSPFFCAREAFEVLIALLESGRIEEYPHDPFVGLSDESVPDNYESELLKKFGLEDEVDDGDEALSVSEDDCYYGYNYDD